MAEYFKFDEYGTNARTEVMAGAATFMTMAYIIVVNPAILQAAGMPFGPSMVATILSAVFGCTFMGLYANRPFAVAPYMGTNTFVAYTVVGVLGYSWQTALGAVFISGVLLFLLTVTGGRTILAQAVPKNLKYSFVVGVGLFISYVGLTTSGIVVGGEGGTLLKAGALTSPSILLAIGGFLLISILMVRGVRGAILIGILATAAAAFFTGIAPLPDAIVSLPPNPAPVLLQLDIVGVLSWGMVSVLLTMFTMDLFFTMSGALGVATQAGLTDANGDLPEIEKTFAADSLATIVGALFGTTTAGVFLESGAGTAAGGRTGLVALTVAGLFAIGLFFSPLFAAIPAAATGPALIAVGMLMLSPLAKIDYHDYTELIPAFAVIVMMIFTGNLGVGLCAGFVLFPVFKVMKGRAGDVHPAGWGLFLLCLLFFVFYPY
ncbi:NCS2 family permease [Methanogenium organophilum]|uniref:NCS2 family permease n=1 Tax=Methanogenium organophilum TaxID=2199 RepID=A0A9X9S5A9_METOG|nr:NCS2 family permease [Methanogenium organophilum]WAI01723.1 NCS2 family permease [Methanogenium organophilum]